MRADLITALQRAPVLADGAMGTQLQLAGLEPGSCGELWNLNEPARVEEIHKRYLEAGAEIIITNTFGGSRFALDRHQAGHEVASVNRAGAAIARRAVGNKAWLLGDIGPFGGFLAPLGEHEQEDVYAAFVEQASALLEGGVDGLIIETMSALEEAVLAVRAAKGAGASVVVASMAFDATRFGPRTMMGVTPEAAALGLLDAGADVVGANCGTALSLADHAGIVRLMRSVAPGALIISQPNAGEPERLADGGVAYGNDAEMMAAGIELILAAGANIIGGCCGTTPDHIRAFSSVLRRRGTSEMPAVGSARQ